MKFLLITVVLLMGCAAKGVAKFPPGCRDGNSTVALWVWEPLLVTDHRDSVRRIVRDWKVTRVYIAPSGKRLGEAVEFLKGLEVEIFIVESTTDLKERFNPELVGRLGVAGYQIDLEPYWGKDINEFRRLVPDYLLTLKRLRSRVGKRTFSVAIPHWFDRIRVGSKSLVRRVMEIADEVVVMAYSPSLGRSFMLSKEEIEIGEKLGKKVLIGLEATAYQLSDTEPMSLNDLKVIRSIRCRGVEGFVINSLDALL